MEYEINKTYQSKIEVEKSTFISYLFRVETKDEFIGFLNKIKEDNPKARHYCYAYIINNEMKYSDDGEPQGTAGRPILNVIVNRKLNNVGLIVVRYFGGTLLGSGRLLRTYVVSATNVMNLATLNEVVTENEITANVTIDTYEIFKNYLLKKQFSIKNTKFNDKIEIVFYTPLNYDENLESIFYKKVTILSNKIVKHQREVH
jgi:Uncharacterized conserved protein